MKIFLSTLLFTSYCWMGPLFVFGENDKIAKLDISSNKIPIKKESDQWLRVSVPFKFQTTRRFWLSKEAGRIALAKLSTLNLSTM